MAAPSAPSAPELAIGPVPHSLYVRNPVVATAVKYTCYLSATTGVGQSAFLVKKEAGVPDMEIHDLPDWPEVFVAQTATNAGDEESVDSAEDTIADWQ